MSQLLISQGLPLLKISDDKHYLVTESGAPFFWLGGTAWELVHRLNKQEIDNYLKDRAEKGFTVVQTVVLAELDGLNTANAYGQKPLLENDPTKLNENYLELVDYVLDRANELGLYVALLPTWGDKYNKKWGIGPEIFNEENAAIFGENLARRYLSRKNLIWVLGGDRGPESKLHYAVIRSMAKGIRKIDNIHLMSYHPLGGKKASDFFDEDWLQIDMFQSGHSRMSREYDYVLESHKTKIHRPVINGESRYENIRDRFWEEKHYGWLDDGDVRVSAYWSMIAGAAGYTYGCNDIWQMYDNTRAPQINARTDWPVALDLPGSLHMKFMKELFERLPWQQLIPDQELIENDNPENEGFMLSAMGVEKDFVLAYSPVGSPIEINLKKMAPERVKAFWFNPRSGRLLYIDEFSTSTTQEFRPWAEGWGSDFLLLLVDNDMPYDLEGLIE